ncbi:N-acetylmuramic acid 6-phosphate etherase [Marinihelvus fidelis]|uniref:N-acetylmuramic acid 6-phosphate etherase n=1 Tax=Marinihelvus fidelis TaxID=2613842 RepID=A0A5N0TCP6_9GAMM|nr:N-acetylmuramic acid 6-phosphate etherase [Marinihelvus fidelis]KAA9132802.1 N-acetylmuramic acid 6-phosphate etherase [Marinihelvus fidelis]
MTERELPDNANLAGLTTEARNPRSQDLDALSTLEFVRLLNSEDAGVANAVADAAEDIAQTIDIIAERMRRGGRLVYSGAGTSGRLGVLDASECPPTFNAEPGRVVGLIAGGEYALTNAVEGAEDSPEQGRADLEAIGFGPDDALVGIAASGRTPYVIGALDHAREIGAAAIAFTCNAGSEMTRHADLSITTVVGPEVLTGSTRMKAGTATKMVLNMLSTGAMVRLGKTYGNLMVDLQAKNVKLVERAIGLVITLTDCTREQAKALLDASNGEVKTAVLVQLAGVSPGEARERLAAVNGQLGKALAGSDAAP